MKNSKTSQFTNQNKKEALLLLVGNLNSFFKPIRKVACSS